MCDQSWLSDRLRDQLDSFRDFTKCLAFTADSVLHNIARNADETAQSPATIDVLESEQAIHTYLDKSHAFDTDICILAFLNSSNDRNGRLPLPISRKLYEHVTQRFDIDPTFLAVMNTGLARYTCSNAQVLGGEEQHNDSAWRFVIQQNRSHSCLSMALTIDLTTGRTRALIFGLERWLITDLFDSLRALSPIPYGPMVVPLLALEIEANWFSETVKKLHDQIHAIEITTGMRQNCNPTDGAQIETEGWKKLDLISTTRNLSSLLSRLAFLKMQAETGDYLMDQMRITSESLLKSRNGESKQIQLQSISRSIQKVKDIQCWYLGIRARCSYLSERTAAQTQTVYTLIASQESLTNIEIARTSRDIAEMSRRDNQLMLRIAEESRAVAQATARDSAAMRVIAAVTVLFLPATFTATFFSMSFFSFLGAGGERLSPWLWVYFVVTGILTAAIQATWKITSKKREKEIVVDVPKKVNRLSSLMP